MATGDDLADLKIVMKEFVADLRNIFTRSDEQRDLLIIQLFFEKMSPERIMINMINKVLPHASIIALRDSNYFIEHDSIFQALPASRAKHYKEFWSGAGGKSLSDNDKQAIWAYFDTIIEIVKNYKKIN
ncbi:hypothetical protein ES703_92337 [subsurface metagenome]